MAEKQFCNQLALADTAKELGLPLKVVREIVDTQSEYVRIVMESGSFDSIRLAYLGIFRSKPKEIQMINHLKGMTPEQAKEFKKAVRTGKIRLDLWNQGKQNDTELQ